MENKDENVNFTEEQQQVISHKTGNLLVSASAGSGKTKVLIAKIVDYILNDYAKLKDILVVTFTNDASQEIKSRLSNEISNSQKEKLLAQLDDLSTSDILTFDKFCIKVIREFGYKIGVNTNFGVCDAGMSKVFQSRALDNVLAKHNKNFDANFAHILDFFYDSRSIEQLKVNIINLYAFLRSKSVEIDHYKNLLNETYSQNFDNNIITKFYNEKLLETADYYKTELKKLFVDAQAINSVNVCDVLNSSIGFLSSFGSDVEDNIKMLSLGNSLGAINTRKLEDNEKLIAEKYGVLRADCNKRLAVFAGCFGQIGIDQVKKDLSNSKDILFGILNLIEEFDIEYQKIKKNYAVLDFADLEKLANNILQDQSISDELKNKYKYIFIDEYQDTNDMQESIIKNITTGENLCMVGDVKQSIYRFRQAEPKIFVNKYRLYKDMQNGKVIELNKNFRSRVGVLEFANLVFDKIMTEKTADLDYKHTAELECGMECEDAGKVEVIVLNKPQRRKSEVVRECDIYSVKNAEMTFDETTQIQKEAFVVAKKIKELVGSEIYDAKLKAKRPVTFADIAILSRKKANTILQIREVLKQQNIPATCSFSDQLFENFDVQIIINILKVINNSQNDIPLVSSLTSHFGKLSFDDVAKIRSKFPNEKYFYQAVLKYQTEIKDEITNKLNIFFAKIDRYRQVAYNKNLCELIVQIVNDEDFETYFAMNNTTEDFENHMHLLVQNIGELKDYSLVQYLNYVDTFASESVFEENIKDSEDAVAIGTIHASKGLEYPIVFLIDAGGKFSDQSLRNKILMENDFGFACNNFNFEKRVSYASPVTIGEKLKIKEEEKKEEMRLLYVALTRAQNNLYVVGSADDIKFAQSEFEIKMCGSYLSWILSALSFDEIETLKTKHSFKKQLKNSKVLFSVENSNCDFVTQQNELKPEKAFNCSDTMEILNHKFTHSKLLKKQSVTQIMQSEQTYTTHFVEDGAETKSEDALLIGTEYHKFMQYLDFSKPSEIEEQISKLVDCGVLSLKEIENVELQKIKTAIQKLNEIISFDDKVLKEQKFLSYFPANLLVNTNETERVLVQGIADLIIIKPNGIYLVDYKTSRLKSEADFAKKYKTQLDIYAKAIENFYQKPVVKKYIYSFSLNKLIII